jgi:hypothetical protein
MVDDPPPKKTSNRFEPGLSMFRFTIRDVLWLMVVIALAFGCALALEKYLIAAGVWK